MEKTNYLINIHSHILPEIDDGARSTQMALDMLKESWNQGVEKVILSFHFYPENHQQKEKAENQFRSLQDEITGNMPKVYLGNEIMYDSNSLAYVKSGRASTLAGSKYVLLEFKPSDSIEIIHGAIREFKLNGYRPIIAHAERYESISDMSALIKIIDSGGYIQINARNFLTEKLTFGEKRRRKSLIKLLQLGLVHFIADDCHDLKERGPCLGLAYNQLIEEGQINEEKLNAIFFANQQKVLDDVKI